MERGSCANSSDIEKNQKAKAMLEMLWDIMVTLGGIEGILFTNTEGVCFLMENMFINISQMHNIYVSAMRDQI